MPDAASCVLGFVERLLGGQDLVDPARFHENVFGTALGEVGEAEHRVEHHALVAFAVVGGLTLVDREGGDRLPERIDADDGAVIDALRGALGAVKVHQRALEVAADPVVSGSAKPCSATSN